MKKEVEKLSHAVQKSTEDKSKAEMDLCQSQIGALSEAKDLCELQIFMIFICAVSPQWAKKWKKNLVQNSKMKVILNFLVNFPENT